MEYSIPHFWLLGVTCILVSHRLEEVVATCLRTNEGLTNEVTKPYDPITVTFLSYKGTRT